ncbi:four helix bundle protein [Candidatus Dependentiae bacterium]|nr:four helix bundle protein [Candidatus Dependentiae bacterium]
MKGTKDLSERFLNFSFEIVNLTKNQNNNFALKHISNQLLKSGTSAGANYEEASCGESRKDFIHKLHIVFKELRETLYWLKLLDYAGVQSKKLKSTILECEELCKIISKSLITAKQKLHK